MLKQRFTILISTKGLNGTLRKICWLNRANCFTWLKESAPEPEVVWVYTMRYTFHNLKVLTKAEMTGKNLDHLYRNDGFYSCETLKQAIHTQASTELPSQLMDSIREVHEYCEESSVLQGIDVIYDRYFLTEQRRLERNLGIRNYWKKSLRLLI